MPRLENLQANPFIRPLGGGATVDPAQPSGEDKQIPAPITGTQAEAQKKPKALHFHETQMYVDNTTWINVYLSKWIKAYFNVQDSPTGNVMEKDKNFYVARLKALPPKADKPAARKSKADKHKAPKGARGMRLIYIPVKPDESPEKGGDLANHPQSKKNGVKYLTMRIPTIASLDAVALLIKKQFSANTPKRFYTDRGTSVTIPSTMDSADLGSHPGLKPGVQTGTR